MSNFFKEFKEFALKGNMIDLAVGMIVGGAFTSIVSSLVDDIINPFLGIFTGKIDFASLFVTLDGKDYASMKEATDAGAAVIKYGSFISALINFLTMALVVFLLVRAINRAKDKLMSEPDEAVTIKECPLFKSEIPVDAVRCPNCTSILNDDVQAAVDAALKTAEAEPAQ